MSNLAETMRDARAEAIREAIRQTRGNMKDAAELLGIPRPTLYRYLRDCGMDAPAERAAAKALPEASVAK